MKNNRNTPYYLVAVLIFIAFKFWYKTADNSSLQFLLWPTSKIVGWITGSQGVFFPDKGFLHNSLHIVIDKSCSGFNFWVLSFALLVFVALKFIRKDVYRIWIIPGALFEAWCWAFIVNSSRIAILVNVVSPATHAIGNEPNWLHETIGAFVYLSFLVGIFLFYHFMLNFIAKRRKL